MRIKELFEQTVAPVPPGQPTPPPQTGGQVTTSTQATPQAGQPVQAPQTTGTTPPGAQTVDPQQQQQIQQIQQASKNTMTDLDKIAAQIVGLKQKQQELQQQAQKVGL